jgi:hypothetical protein
MQQLTLPYRIAIVGLLVVAALWFAVLKPSNSGSAAPAPTAPGVTGLANDVAKAHGAVDASNAAAARTQTAADGAGSGGTAAGTSGTAVPQPVAKAHAKAKAKKPGLAADALASDPSRPLLSAVDAGKVVVLLFWNRKGSDDRATRDALRAVNRHHGKVVTRVVPIRDVGKYEAITLGAKILASPTVLVIGAKGKATSIAGFTQAREIDQTVADVGGKGF